MSSKREAAPPLYLGGPTAVGKSEVALELARRLEGEVISVDSMQVYRGLDIGTAKPSLRERAEVTHHLIDMVDLGGAFDAAKFRELALEAMGKIAERGHVPILCGGTGLYFQALLGGLGKAPASDPVLRAELEGESLELLLEELKGSDPAFYEVVDRQNPRRVIRAVEAIRQTGRPFSELRAAWGSGEPALMFVLRRTSEDLGERSDVRVDRMFERGLVEEVEGLLRAGLRENRTAMQAIGYRQVVQYLDGVRSLDETVALVKVRTRQFARRQMTWFRKQPGVCWIDLEPETDLMGVAEEILRRWKAG